jgi:hypothetical protein
VIVCLPLDVLLQQRFRVLDEVLSRGPAEMSGGLDTVHRSGYAAYSGLLSPESLHSTEGLPATSLRYQQHCHVGFR